MNRSTIATRRFRRLTATVALGAALGLSLVACGDDGDSADERRRARARAPTVETADGAPVHQRQVRGRCHQCRLVQGGRHPAADRQPRLPRAPSCRRRRSRRLRHQRGRRRQRRQACHDILDSGDSTDMSISTASAGTMVAGKPSVVIGAESSSVSLNFVDTLADAKITRSPRPTPPSTCPATRRSTSAPPRRTPSRATRSAP